jgi:DNA-binding YbaB/EbfC family protein
LASYINRLRNNETLKNPFSRAVLPDSSFYEPKRRSMSKNIIGNIMKQAQQMQERVKKLQEEAAGKTVEASSGGGMVTVVANGRQEVLSIKIDPSVVDPKDIDMLQDLVTAAVNEALRKSQDLMKDEMAKLTAGMGLPSGLI